MAIKKRKRRNRFTVRSGRIILGKIEKVGKAFTWEGKRGHKDSGVTDSLRKAQKLIADDAGLSPRQFEIKMYRDK